MSDYDIAVIGAGVAGLTAARHAAEGGARVVLLDRMGVGGQVTTVEGITNFPGRPEPVAGYDLGVELLEEAEAAGAEIMLAEVAAITRDGAGFRLDTSEGELLARAVVLAVGSTRRRLGVPGEETFDGRGVSHCASCDGPFYRGRRVVVVGGGDSAFDEARVLADFAAEVIVVHRGSEPTAVRELVDRALAHDNVRVLARTTVEAVHGEEKVAAVTMRDLEGATESHLETDGLFVYTGLDPNTSWLDGLVDLDAHGRIRVDDGLATSVPGLFAAGDVRSGTRALLAESVEDGAIVARSALEILRAG